MCQVLIISITEVREYWIVDLHTKKVIVYYLEQPDLRMESCTFQGTIHVNIGEDFFINLQGLGL